MDIQLPLDLQSTKVQLLDLRRSWHHRGCAIGHADVGGRCRWRMVMVMVIYLVVSNIIDFHPYLGRWSDLSSTFQLGWNHQLVMDLP